MTLDITLPTHPFFRLIGTSFFAKNKPDRLTLSFGTADVVAKRRETVWDMSREALRAFMLVEE